MKRKEMKWKKKPNIQQNYFLLCCARSVPFCVEKFQMTVSWKQSSRRLSFDENKRRWTVPICLYLVCINFDGSFILLHFSRAFCTYQQFAFSFAVLPFFPFSAGIVHRVVTTVFLLLLLYAHIFGVFFLCMCGECASFTSTRHISSIRRFAAMKNELLSNGLLFMFTFYMKMFRIKKNITHKKTNINEP